MSRLLFPWWSPKNFDNRAIYDRLNELYPEEDKKEKNMNEQVNDASAEAPVDAAQGTPGAVAEVRLPAVGTSGNGKGDKAETKAEGQGDDNLSVTSL